MSEDVLCFFPAIIEEREAPRHERVEESENARKEMEKLNGEGTVSQKMF